MRLLKAFLGLSGNWSAAQKSKVKYLSCKIYWGRTFISWQISKGHSEHVQSLESRAITEHWNIVSQNVLNSWPLAKRQIS
jgi:hypothetical protein